MNSFDLVDSLVMSGRYHPYWGWHDDHRAHDSTPEYRPALQQVKNEFQEFCRVLERLDVNSNCLNLGIGEVNASHDAWCRLFVDRVISIDWRVCFVSTPVSSVNLSGHDTADLEAKTLAGTYAPYDLLFIDAGHSYQEVRQDFLNYSPLVSSGGIIAFHDALKRPGFEEIAVHKFLAELSGQDHTPDITYIGSEVGIAYMVQP